MTKREPHGSLFVAKPNPDEMIRLYSCKFAAEFPTHLICEICGEKLLEILLRPITNPLQRLIQVLHGVGDAEA